ncbi:MAG: hypothetical protein WEC16_00085 [Anaerolineales bacterium]
MKRLANAKRGMWQSWLWANTIALALNFALLGAMSQLVDLLNAHGATVVGLAAHAGSTLAGGAFLGFMQQRVLELSPVDKRRWIIASVFVYAVSFIGGELLGGLFFSLTIAFLLFGVLSGIWQSFTFGNLTRRASRWILISSLGYTVAGLAASALLSTVYKLGESAFLEAPVILSQGLIGAIGGAVAGLLTGFGLESVIGGKEVGGKNR